MNDGGSRIKLLLLLGIYESELIYSLLVKSALLQLFDELFSNRTVLTRSWQLEEFLIFVKYLMVINYLLIICFSGDRVDTLLIRCTLSS